MQGAPDVVCIIDLASVLDEHGEWRPRLLEPCGHLRGGAEEDRDHLRAQLLKLGSLPAQLRQVLVAEQSAQVPEEDEQDLGAAAQGLPEAPRLIRVLG